MIKIDRLDNGRAEGYKRERYTLEKGDRVPCAASTKKYFVGPGTFVRETFPDGGRSDMPETARVSEL